MSQRIVPGYEVVGELGRGASSVVYIARQSQLGGRSVALKVIQRTDIDATTLRRFERERASLARLSRVPGVVTVFDAGVTDDGWPWLSMELMEGGSLAEWIRTNGSGDADLVVEVGLVLCEALAAAHDVGVLHRDIKPENVLLDREGRTKLADFGIASVSDMGPTRSTSSSLRGFTGTIAHAAPELLSGSEPSIASDIYGLGSTLFTMIAGHAPYVRPGEENLLALLRRIAVEPIPSLEPYGAPPAVAAAITKCLAIEPEERPPSAAALADALRQACGDRLAASPLLPVTPIDVDASTAARSAPPTGSSTIYSQTWSSPTVHEVRPEPPSAEPTQGPTRIGVFAAVLAAGLLFAGGVYAAFQDDSIPSPPQVAALEATVPATSVPNLVASPATTVAVATTIVETTIVETTIDTTVAPTTVAPTTLPPETVAPATLPPDVTPPVIAVTSAPDGGQANADGRVAMWGVVEIGAAVSVDGVPADYVPGDGTWSHESSMDGAPSKTFTIVATDPAGNATTATLTLVMPAPPPAPTAPKPNPTVNAPSVSLSGPTSITAGVQASWTANVSGAVGGTWALSGSPTVEVSRPNWTPSSTGFAGTFNVSGATYTLTLTVFNSAGVQRQDSITFTVF